MNTSVLLIQADSEAARERGRFFQNRDYQVFFATHPNRATSGIKSHKPSIAILELGIPGLTTRRFCRWAKYNRETVYTSLILLVPSQVSFTPSQALELGATVWLEEGISNTELGLKVEAIAQERLQWENREVLGNWVEFNLSSTVETVYSVRKFIETLLNLTVLNGREIQNFAYAVAEILMNSVEHGNRFDSSKRIKGSYVVFREKIVIKLQDEGEGFILESVPDPISNPLEVAKARALSGKRPGGYGIAMTRKFVDGIQYNDKGTSLILTKNLSGFRA